jgi:hypothetical protein
VSRDDWLPLMVGQNHENFYIECQGCDVITALAAGHSSAVHGLQTGGTLKRTWVPSNMVFVSMIEGQCKKCPSQQCKSLVTLSGQNGLSYCEGRVLQTTNDHRDVVGIVDVSDVLEPDHIKQSFKDTSECRLVE